MGALREQRMRCAISHDLLTVKKNGAGKTALMSQVSFDRLDNSKPHSAPGNIRAVCCIFQVGQHYVMSPKRFLCWMALHNCAVPPSAALKAIIRALLARMPYEEVWEAHARPWEAKQQQLAADNNRDG